MSDLYAQHCAKMDVGSMLFRSTIFLEKHTDDTKMLWTSNDTQISLIPYFELLPSKS